MNRDLIAGLVLLLVGGAWVGWYIVNPDEASSRDNEEAASEVARDLQQREQYVAMVLKTIEDIDRDSMMVGNEQARDCSAFADAPQSLYVAGWSAQCFLSARDDPFADVPDVMTADERSNFERHCQSRSKVPVTKAMADAYLAAVECRMHNLAITKKAAAPLQ